MAYETIHVSTKVVGSSEKTTLFSIYFNLKRRGNSWYQLATLVPSVHVPHTRQNILLELRSYDLEFSLVVVSAS